VHDDDRQQGCVPVANVEGQHVRQRGGLRVDVAAHREHRRDAGEVVEHREVADVTAVEDVVGRLRCHVRAGPRVRPAVRVGDDDQAQGAVAELQGVAAGTELCEGLGHGDCLGGTRARPGPGRAT